MSQSALQLNKKAHTEVLPSILVNNEFLTGEERKEESSLMYHYKPRESNLQKQVLQDIMDNPESSLKEQANYLQHQSDIYLQRAQNNKSTQLQYELQDKLASLKNNVHRMTSHESQKHLPSLNTSLNKNNLTRISKQDIAEQDPFNIKMFKGREVYQGRNYTGVDAQEFQEAFRKYHSYLKSDYSGHRKEIKDYEMQKQKEAQALIKQLQKEKEYRLKQQRVKVQKLIDKNVDAISQAKTQLENVKRVQSSYLLDAPNIISQKVNEIINLDRNNKAYYSQKQTKKKALHLNNDLVAQRLKWKPKIPLYKELEVKYKNQEDQVEREHRMKLYEIRQSHRPIDKSEIYSHQRQYDLKLKERANAVGDSLFRQKQRENSYDDYDLSNVIDVENEFEDLELRRIFMKRKQQQSEHQSSRSKNRSKTQHEKQNEKLKEKAQRRNKYSKLIVATNQAQFSPVKTPMKDKKNELEETRSSQPKEWAKVFLQNNNEFLSKQIEYVKQKANFIEESAQKVEEKIKLPRQPNISSKMYNEQVMENVYEKQQVAGDKLLDAIRAKLALLDAL